MYQDNESSEFSRMPKRRKLSEDLAELAPEVQDIPSLIEIAQRKVEYQNLDSQLKNFTDAYLNSLQTDLTVLNSTAGSLLKIQQALDALDSSASNDVVKQLRKLDSKIQAGIKKIKKASQLQSLMPDDFVSLKNEIEELSEKMALRSESKSLLKTIIRG